MRWINQPGLALVAPAGLARQLEAEHGRIQLARAMVDAGRPQQFVGRTGSSFTPAAKSGHTGRKCMDEHR